MAWTQSRRPPSAHLHPREKARVLRAHGGVCHGCGHGDAEQVDHITPWFEWVGPLSVHHPSNTAPMHGQPCPTCGKRCHDDKTKAESARARARARARGKRPREQHPGTIA